MPREFRTPASLQAEKETRAKLCPFLETLGFRNLQDQRKSAGSSESQTIRGIDPLGREVAMRVKLCWRRGREGKVETYSATQLMAKVKSGRWQEGLEEFTKRLHINDVTHVLVVQRDGEGFCDAASIAVDSLVPIWIAQRDESARLIELHAMGRRQKNHAVNGGSPTLWLRDDVAPTVPDKLWHHPGVIDLMKLATKPAAQSKNDTLDDLIGFDPELIGRDAAERIQKISSGVKRDPAVRQAVLNRSGFTCENPGCGAKRDYPGFLDVHHILGVEESDRPWTCVALCPNCHREAHAAPDRDKLNVRLREFAGRFSPTKTANNL